MHPILDCLIGCFYCRISTKNQMQKQLEKLMENCPENDSKQYWKTFIGFLDLFSRFLTNKNNKVRWKDIQSLSNDTFLNYDNLLIPEHEKIKTLLSKLVVIKLNGGLGTSMDCVGAKSLLFVRNNHTFLDLIVQQIVDLNDRYDIDVPLVLMNSFNTNKETLIAIEKYRKLRIKIVCFNQSKYPRIYSNNYNLVPETYNDENKHAWYPPGHGDFYEAFYQSNLWRLFMEDEKEICMVSNADNLGATVDFQLLNKIINTIQDKVVDFMMEVTPKTEADRKGGAVVKIDDKLHLLEVAQVPQENIEEFQKGDMFKLFNTNNLWIRLSSILKLVEDKRHLLMDLILNYKKLKGNEVIQLETAIGSAIHLFENVIGVVVPRFRFLPIKTTSDFFLIQSNVYVLENGVLFMNPLRKASYPPKIEFIGNNFTSYSEIKNRFKEIPDCLNLLSLTLSGDIIFGKGVILRGDVVIKAVKGEKIDVPDNTVLEDCQILEPYH